MHTAHLPTDISAVRALAFTNLSHFTATSSLKKAQDIVAKGALSAVQVAPAGSGRHSSRICGRCAAASAASGITYEVSVQADSSGTTFACSCPVGGGCLCKHALALLLWHLQLQAVAASQASQGVQSSKCKKTDCLDGGSASVPACDTITQSGAKRRRLPGFMAHGGVTVQATAVSTHTALGPASVTAAEATPTGVQQSPTASRRGLPQQLPDEHPPVPPRQVAGQGSKSSFFAQRAQRRSFAAQLTAASHEAPSAQCVIKHVKATRLAARPLLSWHSCDAHFGGITDAALLEACYRQLQHRGTFLLGAGPDHMTGPTCKLDQGAHCHNPMPNPVGVHGSVFHPATPCALAASCGGLKVHCSDLGSRQVSAKDLEQQGTQGMFNTAAAAAAATKLSSGCVQGADPPGTDAMVCNSANTLLGALDQCATNVHDQKANVASVPASAMATVGTQVRKGLLRALLDEIDDD